MAPVINFVPRPGVTGDGHIEGECVFVECQTGTVGIDHRDRFQWQFGTDSTWLQFSSPNTKRTTVRPAVDQEGFTAACPLPVGTHTITCRQTTRAGVVSEGTKEVTVSAATNTRYIDLSAVSSGDGSVGSPWNTFNDLNVDDVEVVLTTGTHTVVAQQTISNHQVSVVSATPGTEVKLIHAPSGVTKLFRHTGSGLTFSPDIKLESSVLRASVVNGQDAVDRGGHCFCFRGTVSNASGVNAFGRTFPADSNTRGTAIIGATLEQQQGYHFTGSASASNPQYSDLVVFGCTIGPSTSEHLIRVSGDSLTQVHGSRYSVGWNHMTSAVKSCIRSQIGDWFSVYHNHLVGQVEMGFDGGAPRNIQIYSNYSGGARNGSPPFGFSPGAEDILIASNVIEQSQQVVKSPSVGIMSLDDAPRSNHVNRVEILCNTFILDNGSLSHNAMNLRNFTKDVTWVETTNEVDVHHELKDSLVKGNLIVSLAHSDHIIRHHENSVTNSLDFEDNLVSTAINTQSDAVVEYENSSTSVEGANRTVPAFETAKSNVSGFLDAAISPSDLSSSSDFEPLAAQLDDLAAWVPGNPWDYRGNDIPKTGVVHVGATGDSGWTSAWPPTAATDPYLIPILR